MIDVATYNKMHGGDFSDYFAEEHERLSYLPKTIGVDDPTPDDELTMQLMPAFVFGFNLQEKKWSMLNI